MYSEIKSNSKVIINRLDENEKILLEEIYNKSQLPNTIISTEKLSDETGEFGGILLNIEEDIDNKYIEIKENFPEKTLVEVGSTNTFSIETNIPNNDYIVTYRDNEQRLINEEVNEPKIILNDTDLKTIEFKANRVTEEDSPVILYYSINADGYKSITGKMEINVVARDLVPVSISVTDSVLDLEIADYELTVTDQNGTEQIVEIESNSVSKCNLGVGTYTLTINKAGYKEYTSQILIKETDLAIPDTLNISALLVSDL